VSSLISMLIVGSSLDTCRSVSMSFGRSSMFCASTLFVITGSEMWSIDSKGVISIEDTVEPAMASFSPVTAATLPAGTRSTSSRSPPMNRPTDCRRFLPAVPETYSSWPFSRVPENTRPVAISPAWGSIEMSVTMNTTSPSSSTSRIEWATSVESSPRQIRGTRRGWASTGLGKCSHTMSSTTSDSGVCSWSSSRLRSRSISIISGNPMPVRAIDGAETPHLYSAEPKATVPSSTETVQSSGMSSISSAIPRMSSLTSRITAVIRSCISWGPSCSSEMRRSILLMNSVGLTPSRSAWRSTVSVWGIAPSTASTTTIAPSTARIARVTSPPKSTCPGVSMRLIRWLVSSYSWVIETFAASIVMPRSCSSSSVSIASCSPAVSSEIIPAPASRLSVSVVLPWSTWAAMAMFRMFSGSSISRTHSSTIFSRLLIAVRYRERGQKGSDPRGTAPRDQTTGAHRVRRHARPGTPGAPGGTRDWSTTVER